MHILFISQYFHPEIGAASERISGFAANLCKAGHSVTVITGFPNYPLDTKYPGYAKRLFKAETRDGVKVMRVWLFTSSHAGAPARLLNYVSFMLTSLIAGLWVSRADRIVATSGPIFAALSGCLLAALKKVPFIFDVRDIWPERIYAGTDIKRGWAIRQLERLEMFLYRKAEKIVAVTKGVKGNIVSKGIDAGKITVITNGVDTEIFHPGPKDRALAEKLGIMENQFVVVYAGTLGLLQDLGLLIGAAERLKRHEDIVFLIVGGGSKRDEFIQQVKARNIRNIIDVPPVSPAELNDYINLSDIGINANTDHPHNDMAIPVKMFPYMACGKPVVFANKGEIALLVEDHDIGRCVSPGDAAAFCDAILQFYRDRDLCRQCGENGRRAVSDEFSIERLSKSLERVLMLKTYVSNS